MSAPPLPLAGLGVVITRPRAAAEVLAAKLAAAGARPFIFPALAIERLPDSPPLGATLAGLDDCDLAVFVSANAVEHGLALARQQGAWPAKTRVAAIGEATAQALRNSGFGAVISPQARHDSESLLALEELKSVDGRKILIFRGQGGRELLREALESRGAHVTYVECYRRTRPVADAAPLLHAWSLGEIHAVSVLSAETLENFVAMIGSEGEAHLSRTALVVPHEAIATRPLARRFARVAVSSPDEGMVQTLASLRVTS
jgi:uroporphyrinogen-III synthase